MGHFCNIISITSPIPQMNLTCCVPVDDLKRISSMLRYLRSLTWVFRKVYSYIALFLCVSGVILFISLATAPPSLGSFPQYCVAGQDVLLWGAGATVSFPFTVVPVVIGVPCTVLCVTTVGFLVYSCTEDCTLKFLFFVFSCESGLKINLYV